MQETTNIERISVPDEAALALTTIGALNWGLIGLFSFDLVARLLGRRSLASRIVYSLVGLSGVYAAYYLYKSSTSITLPPE
ncbi:MAG: DUF378 domain-containing protein [Candidatus Aquicultor sp.]